MPRFSSIASTPPVTVAGLALGLHLVVWIALPALLEGSIRLDVAEHVLQGREWLLAYPTQPPFSMWLVALATDLGPARYVAIYLLGQMLALSGLVAAASVLWRKAPAAFALAILIGLPTPFLTYVPIQVNHNIGVMPFWGLAIATGYAAFEYGRLRDWLMFGAAVGIGVWAKYSIFQLVVPLALAFFVVPQWRRRTATPGPWLAGALAAAIAAPHALAVAQAPGSLAHALRTVSSGPLDNVLMSVGFVATGGVAFVLMGMVAAAAVGIVPLWQAIVRSLVEMRQDRLAFYLHVAVSGPMALIALAALLLGVRPRVLWLTPMVLSSAVWWAYMAASVTAELPQRLYKVAFGLGALFAVAYVGGRLVVPLTPARPSYPDFDGPALARLAERHWRTIGGPIPYLVSFSSQRGRQAAGSIAFDSGDHPDVFESADVRTSPWIDVADLVRRGALVVSTRPLTSNDRVAGRPIENIVEFERPTVRAFRTRSPIFFGIVRPAGP